MSPPPIPEPESSLQELGYEDCVFRLASQHVGRLAVMVGNYPQVFPLNYRLDGDVVVFRTHLGTKLLAAHHANVAFEVDEINESTHSGWSVLVQGMAEDVTDRGQDMIAERSRDLGVSPWPPGDKPRIIRVIPAHVTGRELISGHDSYWPDIRGYL